jgi:hypothetical protein
MRKWKQAWSEWKKEEENKKGQGSDESKKLSNHSTEGTREQQAPQR